MPKITVGDGPTQDPQDAPNATPSEESYNDAMSRHGTSRFTEADARLVEQYQQVRKSQADDDTEQAQQRGKTAEGRGGQPQWPDTPSPRADTSAVKPNRNASKEEWVDYAVSQGQDRAEADKATKEDLVKRHG